MFQKIKRFVLWFSSGYYNLLLLFLIMLFVFRPFDQGLVYLGAWKLILAATLLSAIYNCNHKYVVKRTTLFFAIASICLSWIDLIFQHHLLFIANAVSTIIFMFIITMSILYDVVLRARVTLETLRGVICAYFMVAFAFAYIYYLIEFIFPGSFRMATGTSVFSYTNYLSLMLYFSFSTLVTIGYGDIVAIRDVSQTGAIIEAIIGQFYVAILVARLVSVYSSRDEKRVVARLEQDFGLKKSKGKITKK